MRLRYPRDQGLFQGLFPRPRREKGLPRPGAPHPTPISLPLNPLTHLSPLPHPVCDFYQSTQGSMISAKALRARFRRDFTVPRLQSVISAISSYDFPSSSRSTNTSR